MKITSIWDLNRLKETGARSLSPKQPKLSISMSTCGLALGADEIFQDLTAMKVKEGLKILLGQTGCSGFCNLEPLGILRLPGKPALIYTQMTVKRARQLLRDVKKKKIHHKGLLCKIKEVHQFYKPDKDIENIIDYHEVPVFKNQLRNVLKNCGLIDPLNVAEYVATGGGYALYKALFQMSSEEVIEDVKLSGLRGRGGAWFPTSFKWSMAHNTSEAEKFVVCNADEGDPGAYKDRTIMEGNPFRLFEGIVLAGYAIGSHQGIIYLREEYPHTFQLLTQAIETAKRYGFLGRNILGSDFNFSLRIVRGGGSYVCGEETALLDSLEGEVGDPRLRPPFPILKGLWERPTIVNNVETLSNIPMIIGQGGESYAKIGTEKAKGAKIFSVIGKVRQPGLYEVPLGTNLKELIYDMAGGLPSGSRLKAVQVGSPFGLFIPADNIDISLDPETLKGMNSMIGSGVIVVLDQNTCLVDTIRHLLSFFIDESCGKCVPCREGVFRMYEIITGIYEGHATYTDLYTLWDLAEMIKQFALCGLGGGAPALVLGALEDFTEDFKTHMATGKCGWKIAV
ncbi:MAG: NADH-ubiquinone oxidoreductase-F iron-sulfur binding region domain-containing protein [Desulfobacterales bacterium]|nr:NADH-ubiquinone oxidoreductase-F iron-sulfur binding region domain-containing protein [Desulfobacterales bacterium]